MACEKCGQEYELVPDEDPKDFECVCGGDLKLVKIPIQYNGDSNKKNGSPKSHNLSQLRLDDNLEFVPTIKYIMNNVFGKFNNSINLIGVYSGLAISLLVLIIAPVFYGLFVASGVFGFFGLLYLVVLTMMIVGGFSTSVLCCKTYSEGMINGGFLGLVALINLGFIIGALWFTAVTVISLITNAFGGLNVLDSTDSSFIPDSSSGVSSPGLDLPIAEIVLLPFLMILFGILGGWMGVFIKNLVKNKIKEEINIQKV